MKKLFKAIAVCAVVGTLCAGTAALAGCSTDVKGEAYGITHGAGYVAYASVTKSGDKIKAVTLTEVCFPDHNTYLVGETATYYAKVTYGNVTMTYDATDGYKVGTQTIKEYFQSEANCKAYYEAVVGNKITAYKTADATTGETDVMTYATLSKEENGYWMCDKKTDGTWDNHATAPYTQDAYSRWKWNRDATVNYVLNHGVEGLSTLVKTGDNLQKVTDPQGSEKTVWTDTNNVGTGATWSDLNPANATGKDHPEKNGVAYVSYAQLILNAYNAAK